MEEKPIIRTAEIEDLAGILEIYNYYILNSAATFDLETYTIDQRLDWFHEHGKTGKHRLLVSEDPETHMILGYACSSSFRPKAAYTNSVESSIYIHPEHTGKKIASNLYAELIDVLIDEGVHRIYACITVPNEASKRLHEHFGFVQVGLFTQAGFKLGRYRDVMWFEKRLP
jgi:phosphinothricin acetyltransferase